MSKQHYISLILLLTPNILLCASAAVHSHILEHPERDSDGSYRARDSEHYTDGDHNVEFDHEAILGSVREAEEYDKLGPDEAKERLSQLLPKMDLNGDTYIDNEELKKWILTSFIKLSHEEAEERMLESDTNRDGVVTWLEYLQDSFGINAEEELDNEDTGDTGMLVREEKAMWRAADKNGDGDLDFQEFSVFTNPEEHEEMHEFLVNQTVREKDQDGDGLIDFDEYIGTRSAAQDAEWTEAERTRFEHELDRDRDGRLDRAELARWLVPDNLEIAEEEVAHLMSAADDDSDGRLSYDEILQHYQVFVGGASDREDRRFDDEL